MDRKEFCEKLVEARQNAGVGKNQMCRLTGFTFVQLQLLENKPNNFAIQKAIDYLYSIGYMMVLRKSNRKGFGIIDGKQFGDWLLKTREGKFSKSSLAKTVGCTDKTIENTENKETIITIDNFLKIIYTFGYEVTFEKIGA